MSAAAPMPSQTRGVAQAADGKMPDAKPSGECGEGDASGLDPRIKFFRDMQLVRGHLLIGDELVKLGKWDEALPHFLHPVEELYTGIAPRLRVQNIRQFDTALNALAATVQARRPEAYTAALKTVEQRMGDADVGMRKFETKRVKMRMETMLAVLRVAASEYAEAIENGRIAKPVEYQDSRGFVWQAERMLDALAPDLAKIDAVALDAVRKQMADLKRVWPAPVPPETPVKEASAVAADISRIELAASPFLR